MKRKILARYIDHTLLKPDATPSQITQLCQEALEFHCASVCVNSLYVPLAAQKLSESDVAVCAVIGFPLGATPTAIKVCETELAIAQGASEIDMVLSIGLLKAGETKRVHEDIAAVTAICHAHGAHLKVIIEAALLTYDEKVTACQLAQDAGADFVKTSTGFAKSGATVTDVVLMRQVVGPAMGVKAAGGIHSYQEAIAMIDAGATRLGASRTRDILLGAPE